MDPAKTALVSRTVLATAAVAGVYYGLARLGLELALAGTASCPIWPASGFALVAAIVLGPKACLGVFIGSWLANQRALPGLHAAAPLTAALACAVVALGSALQALAGARFLKDELGGPDPLSRSRDVIRFAALTPLVCLLAASVGVGSLAASGLLGRELLSRAWLTWWIGDIVGILITTPLLLAWRPRSSGELWKLPNLRRTLAAASALALLPLSAWLGFVDPFPPSASYPLSFLPFTALIWITLLLDFRGATAGAAALAALVQWHTVRGVGPFAAGAALNESLLLASSYVAAAALTAFLLRALFAEREEARAALERRMSEQDEDLWTTTTHLRAADEGRRADSRRIQLYRRIVSELPVGIAVLSLDDPRDPEGWRIIELNPSGLRLSAARDENVAGRRLLDFAPELRGSDLVRACAEALRSHRDVEIADFANEKRVPGGRFSIRVFPLGGPLVGLAFEDVTARKTAEEALARSNGELTQFAYVASHDLQAPLRKAAAFAEQLKLRLGPGLDETSRDFLERMGRSIEGMQQLIDALLKLAQISVRTAAPSEVNLETLSAEVLSDLEDPISRSGAMIERSALPMVLGDPQQIRQLLQNLIGNALKFTAPGKTPKIRLKGRIFDNGRCALIVEDEGVGFEMKFVDRIFQPFQRLHSRQEYPGNGMGLAICQKIIERHGGTISVESSIGQGTRFTVVFPCGRPNELEQAPLEKAMR